MEKYGTYGFKLKDEYIKKIKTLYKVTAISKATGINRQTLHLIINKNNTCCYETAMRLTEILDCKRIEDCFVDTK